MAPIVSAPFFRNWPGYCARRPGSADVLKEAFAGLSERIALALVFGSVARGEEGPRSDVDVLLVGEIGFAEVVRALHEAQARIGREINPVVLSSAEFRKKTSGGRCLPRRSVGQRKTVSDGRRA